MKVVLYGSGERGRETCRHFSQYFNIEEYELLGFMDSDPDKIGVEICGKPVLSLADVKRIDDDIIIVITIASKKAQEEVKTLLVKEGLEDKMFSFDGSKNAYYTSEVNVQILIALLKAHGINKIIASPGTTNINFVKSVQNDAYFELFSAPDERSAAYIACGLAEESNEPVVISCTGATASRNYLPALTEAYYSKLPILAITSSQHFGRAGQLAPQMIDRSNPPVDSVKLSIELPSVYSEEDVWACETKVNTALLELKKDGGGPVHINLVTTYSKYFTRRELPVVRTIERFSSEDSLPPLTPGRVGIFVGSHKKWSKELVDIVGRFCEKYDAVVFCDHTSNYWGNYRILPALICQQESFAVSCSKMDIMIHLGEVSGAYLSLNSNEVWRINSDGRVRDAFKKLRYIFDMSEQAFFEKYVGREMPELCTRRYFDEWMHIHAKLSSNMPELPFSNIWIAQQTCKKLPSNSCLHLGILNTLRSWNFFETTFGICGHANTGGFGIDGCVSTAVGASLSDPDKLVFCFVGDLAFFYDMNVLGNLHVGNNLRLLLVNNGGGAEFHRYNHLGFILNADEQPYVAADGHYGNKSLELVKHYAQDLGFEYMSASNKEEYLSQLEQFVSPQILEKPIIFEVFTESQDESDALYLVSQINHHCREVI